MAAHASRGWAACGCERPSHHASPKQLLSLLQHQLIGGSLTGWIVWQGDIPARDGAILTAASQDIPSLLIKPSISGPCRSISFSTRQLSPVKHAQICSKLMTYKSCTVMSALQGLRLLILSQMLCRRLSIHPAAPFPPDVAWLARSV